MTPARSVLQADMTEAIAAMRLKGIDFGVVSGSDLSKIREQLGEEMTMSAESKFAENGLYAMKKGQLMEK